MKSRKHRHSSSPQPQAPSRPRRRSLSNWRDEPSDERFSRCYAELTAYVKTNTAQAPLRDYLAEITGYMNGQRLEKERLAKIAAGVNASIDRTASQRNQPDFHAFYLVCLLVEEIEKQQAKQGAFSPKLRKEILNDAHIPHLRLVP